MLQEHTKVEADPKRRAKKQWLAGETNDVPERGRLVIEAGGRTIGIYRLDGQLYAYENVCPHQGGPVCQGLLVPRVLELIDDGGVSRSNCFDEHSLHVVCPWHGFEFDIRTGRHAGGVGVALKAVEVSEQEGHVYVTL
jgi:nitrite reductase/ring-hydroxylating ferredoxin subunit